MFRVSERLDLDRNLMEAYPCSCNGCFGAWIGWIQDAKEEEKRADD